MVGENSLKQIWIFSWIVKCVHKKWLIIEVISQNSFNIPGSMCEQIKCLQPHSDLNTLIMKIKRIRKSHQGQQRTPFVSAPADVRARGGVFRGSRVMPVGFQSGYFTGETSIHGVEVCKWSQAWFLCVCCCCEQKAQARDIERKYVLDLHAYVTQSNTEII